MKIKEIQNISNIEDLILDWKAGLINEKDFREKMYRFAERAVLFQQMEEQKNEHLEDTRNYSSPTSVKQLKSPENRIMDWLVFGNKKRS